MNKGKKWLCGTIGITLAILLVIGCVVVYVDPYFHYHKPRGSYTLYNQRYQNDGITRFFDYNAIVTGTSMTENFKTSEVDDLFHVKSIKVPYSGGHFREINDNLRRAFDSHDDIRLIIRSIDYNMICEDENTERKDVEYPRYLYNNNIFDDVNYLYNKDVLFGAMITAINYSKSQEYSTSFDEYSSLNNEKGGTDYVVSNYCRPDEQLEVRIFTEEDCALVKNNIRQNVTSLVKEHADTDFYYFLPPYSMLFWDTMSQKGMIDWCISVERAAIEEMVQYDNLYLFSFNLETELITNLDCYQDEGHYSENINSTILQWMYDGTGRITKDNYLEYLDMERKFYTDFDYDAFLSERGWEGGCE